MCSGGRPLNPVSQPQVETEDAGHQVKQAKEEKWVENELMTRYLCNKLRQEHKRE